MSCRAKIPSTLYALNSSKTCLTEQCSLMLYNSLVLPILSYGILRWGSAGKTLLNRFWVIQKKAVRIITKSQCNAMKLDDLYNFNLGKYMYDQTNQLLPTLLPHNYGRITDLHNYHTRGNRLLYIDTKRTTLASTRFVQSGRRYWNSLPEHIKELHSKQVFSK